MKIKDLKIGTQLIVGFSAMLLFVIALGFVSFRQSEQIHHQTELMYNHPLQVRSAIGLLENDILQMRLGTRDLMLATNDQEKQAAIQLIELSKADAMDQFSEIKNHYLGSKTDINTAYKAFLEWNAAREINTSFAFGGDIKTVKQSISPKGNVGIQRDKMLAEIEKINTFASEKSDELYANSIKLNRTLNRQLILLVLAILLLSFLIGFYFLRSIRKPIVELTFAANLFKSGDMNARSNIEHQNEFGILSTSFNSMVESIQIKTELDDKFASLAALMLSEYDAKRFFQNTLNALAKHTGSQMAAIYLLNDEKTSFEHFESIGIDGNARQSFAADSFEGEFGSVLASRKVQHIKNIAEDTRFIFNTVSGKFIPLEIITLPIFASNEVIAIISLASVSAYPDPAIQLIDRILITLSTRVEGIMAYHKNKEILERMELQNRELAAQKTELASQSLELMEQNRELEMQKKQLFEASRLKTNFLSNMSHELRTPLNSVIALSGVLNRRLANKIANEEYSYLEVIERNGKNLLTLINDILDISRIESGREEVEVTTFNVNNLVAEVVSMIEPQATLKGIELIHAISTSELIIDSDVGKCRHILQNLIANAVKFTMTGKVEISATNTGSAIEVHVSDTGIGISEQNLPHIFDEFRQADGSTSRRFGGTGLGLAIARKYSNLLGGNVTVKSILDQGSTFTLTLPLAYQAENLVIESSSAERDFKRPDYKMPQKPKAGKTILLVEDSEPAIIQLKDLLEESNYRVLAAHDGRQALSVIAQTIPDAMILDLMMPGIDGFEVLKSLRNAEETAHVPVLILTAKHITKEDLKFLKRNNVHQLIQKGDINKNELLNAVASMVATELEDATTLTLQNIEGKPVVLVVEDNADNMITVKAILANDFTILEAVDGDEGVLFTQKYKPNLILMDISLPGVDGIEAFKQIREVTELEHIPIIALTASALTTDREAILAHGFNGHLTKPIDQKVLLDTINKVLYGK